MDDRSGTSHNDSLLTELSGQLTGKQLEAQGAAKIPTPFGLFQMVAFAQVPDDPMPNLALIAEGSDFSRPVLLRMHSECITGDLFHSYRCDCGEQLDEALRRTSEAGGVVLYLRQEGRGIGIINKLKAYGLQDHGADTVEANTLLGLPVDNRNYASALQMIAQLGITRVRLLTNNPLKVEAFAKTGIEVVERVPLEIAKRPENERYLNTKRDEMGHQIS